MLNLIFIDDSSQEKSEFDLAKASKQMHDFMTTFIFLEPTQQRSRAKTMNYPLQRDRDWRTTAQHRQTSLEHIVLIALPESEKRSASDHYADASKDDAHSLEQKNDSAA